MTWSLHRWTWRVASPLYIGATPSGALNRCRVYVPARPLWGALTAELARLKGRNDPQYRQVGNELREHVRFSYLFPAERGGGDWRAWLPEYREGAGLVWAREREGAVVADRQFRQRLLGTRPATAVDPDSDSALDGSLRETECVQAWWRGGDRPVSEPVAMVGYVFVRNNSDLAGRLPELDRIFLGGDSRYGLGRLDRIAMTTAATVFDATVDLGHPSPYVLASRPLAHVPFHDNIRICGELEALGGWDMTGHQQDRRIGGPFWTPGSTLDTTYRWRVEPNGLWCPANGGDD